jgi:hypothetical protein
MMSGKPYQSKLIPYEDEIVALRRRRPPLSFAQISQLLIDKYQLRVCRETIFKFIKVRSRGGRKVYGFCPDAIQNRTSSAVPPVSPTSPRLPGLAPVVQRREPLMKGEFMPLDRYRLRRLPPEEAAAIRKKLEEKGH